MYIGPWQEFYLNKKKIEGDKNELLRSQLEKTLLESLDPASAKKAIDSICPLFNAADSNNMGNAKPVPVIPRVKKSMRRVQARPSDYQRLPNIHSARQQEAMVSTPNSVRSTLSEPIHVNVNKAGSIRPKKKENVRFSPLIPLSNPNGNLSAQKKSQTKTNDNSIISVGYRSDQVVQLMHADKAMRMTDSEDSLNSQIFEDTNGSFAKYWNWDKKGYAGRNGASNKGVGVHPKTLKSLRGAVPRNPASGSNAVKLKPMEDKVADVQRMHDLYKQEQEQEELLKAQQQMRQMQQGDVVKLPVTEGEVIANTTANITQNLIVPKDKHLTDDDFNAVAKYFPSSFSNKVSAAGAMHEDVGKVVDARGGGGNGSDGLSVQTISSYSRTMSPIGSQPVGISLAHQPPLAQLSTASLRSSLKGSPHKSLLATPSPSPSRSRPMSNSDRRFLNQPFTPKTPGGGIMLDGQLLNWCNNLDLDSIDNW